MRTWAKRAAWAAAATAVLAGAALASIEPGSEPWARVMDVKLRCIELKIKAGEAAGKTDDSVAKQALASASQSAQDIHDRLERMLEE